MVYRLPPILVVLIGLTGCTPWLDDVEYCPRGQQSVGGHCVPTPSIVFNRCIETFRTLAVERDRGQDVSVEARAPRGVGGAVEHHNGDRERREFSDLSSAHMDAALAECRRQEQAERDGQLARAWDEAERARAEADAARRERVTVEGELRRVTRAYEAMRGRGEERAESEQEAMARLPPPPTEAIEAPQAETDGDDTEGDDTEATDTDSAEEACGEHCPR